MVITKYMKHTIATRQGCCVLPFFLETYFHAKSQRKHGTKKVKTHNRTQNNNTHTQTTQYYKT